MNLNILSQSNRFFKIIFDFLELILSIHNFQIFVLFKVANISVRTQMINSYYGFFSLVIDLCFSDDLLHINFRLDVLKFISLFFKPLDYILLVSVVALDVLSINT